MKMTSMFKNISDMEVLNSKALEEKELDKGILVHLYSHGYVLVAHHMKVKASVESKVCKLLSPRQLQLFLQMDQMQTLWISSLGLPDMDANGPDGATGNLDFLRNSPQR
uniref:Uncharacterized protein n=1 Tax=Lactuca sativa TaxID=4236 RepID=A0A9R1WB44_LACSA|nr:hypothetical protein LSAT_V11C200075820 [Lactuca sativa]